MIVKALSRKSGTGQLIRYILKPEKVKDKNGKFIVVTRNVRARSVEIGRAHV